MERGHRRKEIRFTNHAREKFFILLQCGIVVSRKKVEQTVTHPDYIDPYSRRPAIIAQSKLDAHKILRVVYREYDDETVIITFYPGKRKQYEQNT